MDELQPVALGEEPADLVVRGGRVFVPEVREFLARDVVVKNGRVAALPEDSTPVIGDETQVLGADDRVVAPGFVDAHTHVDLHQTFENAYHYALEGGTTTVVTEVTGFGTAFGAAGVEALLAATAYLPINVRATVPPQTLFDTFEAPHATEEEKNALVDLLADDRVVGVGETDWIHAVGRDTPAEALFERAHAEGKTVSGHAAGCKDAKLAAFAGIIDDDHEAITGDGIVERVENGIHAIGRYGSIRDDMGALADAYGRIGPAELSLSSDGMWPRDLIDEGHMDAVVRRAIEEGVEPADALRMATLNPARHFGLSDLGSLAPGNVADIVVIDDLRTVNVATVISAGELVVHNHETKVAPRTHEYPEAFYDAARVGASREDFAVPAEVARDGLVRAIAYEGGLLSTGTVVEPAVEDGNLVANPGADALKVSVFDRHPNRRGESFTGFVTGFGFEEGAVATSTTWEAPSVLAVGADDESMHRAVTHVEEMGGGWAVVRDGDVLAELPCRVAAVCSDLEVEETAKLYGAVESALRTLGSGAERPMLGLQTLTFKGVPTLKLSFGGYADILGRRVVGLTPE